MRSDRATGAALLNKVLVSCARYCRARIPPKGCLEFFYVDPRESAGCGARRHKCRTAVSPDGPIVCVCLLWQRRAHWPPAREARVSLGTCLGAGRTSAAGDVYLSLRAGDTDPVGSLNPVHSLRRSTGLFYIRADTHGEWLIHHTGLFVPPLGLEPRPTD